MTQLTTPEYLMLASGRVCKYDHTEGTLPNGEPRHWTKCGYDAWEGPCERPRRVNRRRNSWVPGEPCWVCFTKQEFTTDTRSK